MDHMTADHDAAYTAYYDGPTDEELKEASEWAEFVAPVLAEVLWNE